jgi:hypothetical protein
MTATIGAPAPTFDAEPYVRGEGEPCQVSLDVHAVAAKAA